MWCTNRFNIQQLYALYAIYLRTNSDLCHLQHKLIGFHNRDDKCLQRGTDWVFKYSGLRFVFKGLMVLQKVKRKIYGPKIKETRIIVAWTLLYKEGMYLVFQYFFHPPQTE
jgi:hypothetical protein